MSLTDYRLVLTRVLAETARESFALEAVPAFDVSPSAKPEFGHYACNLAMQLAKPLQRNPRALAQVLAEALTKKMGPALARCEVAGPGFLNLTLAEQTFGSLLHEALADDKPFQWTAADPRRINLEYVSANPTGPLLVVNGRAAAVGSTLANLLQAAGHKVTQEYFVNDAGTQVLELAATLYRELPSNYPKLGLDFSNYKGYSMNTVNHLVDNIKNDTYNSHYQYLRSHLVQGDPMWGLVYIEVAGNETNLFDESGLAKPEYQDVISLIGLVYHTSCAVEQQFIEQQSTLKRFRVQFDKYFREYSIYHGSYVCALYTYVFSESPACPIGQGSNIISKWFNKIRSKTCENEGAKWLRTTDYKDDKDRVIVRSNGKPTYLLSDIAYHLDKWERLGGRPEERLMIDIWGPDHHGHILPTLAGLRAADETIQPENFRVLISGWVTFKQGGQVVAMSKRAGNLVTLDDLLDEVGVDAARYMFLERSPEAPLEFDLELARTQSSENPCYYIQYAYTRVGSIFANAREAGFKDEELTDAALAEVDLAPLFTVNDDREATAVARQGELLRQIAYYPQVVKEAAEYLSPQKLTTYLHNLAGLFHPYYKAVKVLVPERATALARLALARSLQRVLADGLALLGISAPDNM